MCGSLVGIMADPDKWGPGLWVFLHALPRNAESVHSAKAALTHLDLPCPDCRKHYRAFSKDHPLQAVNTTQELERWVFNLHNDVNKRLGKKLYTFDACQRDCQAIENHPNLIKADSLFF